MNIERLMALSVSALFASMAVSHAGPCTKEIDDMQVQVDARINAIAAAGPIGRESTAATMHRQPTPDSIAAAEGKLSEGARVEQAVAAMKRARAADAARDKSGCQRALDEARRAIGP